MEPVTHILTGACLARTGLNRKAAYTTLAMAVAAEFPDIDTLWSLRGPVDGFEHHRGITHTLLAIPFEAALLVAAVYVFHGWRLARATTPGSGPRIPTAAPISWPRLYCFTILALLSHILLDFTNNYGVRPFFPFNAHWFAASIVFIFDPLIFLLLLAALIAPSIFRLIGSEVSSGARRQPFAARGWSVAALLAILALWTFREVQHNHAIQLAMAQSLEAPPAQTSTPPESADPSAPLPDVTPVYLQPQRALASPDPFSPFRWYTVTDFGPLYQLGQADTLNHTLIPATDTHSKPAPTPALIAAESSPLGRVYLDWSPMPFLSTTNPADDPAGRSIVTFADPRFMGDTPILHSSASRSPLTGAVELNAANQVILQTMDGKKQ